MDPRLSEPRSSGSRENAYLNNSRILWSNTYLDSIIHGLNIYT